MRVRLSEWQIVVMADGARPANHDGARLNRGSGTLAGLRVGLLKFQNGTKGGGLGHCTKNFPAESLLVLYYVRHSIKGTV